MWDELLKILGAVAPTIASLVPGGPLAVSAITAVSQILLGKPDGSAAEITQAASAASPEVLERIRAKDQEFQLDMQRLQLQSKQADLEEIKSYMSDVQNARQRQIAVNDRVLPILAVMITLGFFGLLSILIFFPAPDGSRDLLNIMVGVLGTAWIAVVNFYFGSSKTSASHVEALTKLVTR